jgi:DNA-binding transcriptional ArsR family regulator
MSKSLHPTALDLQQVLYALADPSRQRLIQELILAKEIPSTAFQSVQAARGSIAFHLKTLRLAGLTWTRLDGSKRLVSLRREAVDDRFPGLLDAIIQCYPPPLPDAQG